MDAKQQDHVANMAAKAAQWEPPWYNDAPLTARMLERLCRHHYFKNLPGGRDMIAQQHRMDTFKANQICLLTGLATLQDELRQLHDLQSELGAMVCAGAEIDPHWLDSEFAEMEKALDAKRPDREQATP